MGLLGEANGSSEIQNIWKICYSNTSNIYSAFRIQRCISTL